MLCLIFMNLGRQIARRPLYFILFSILVFSLLVTAIPYLKLNKNFYYMLSSDNGKTSISKKFIDENFPMNSSYFVSEIRFTKIPEALMIYITTPNGENMLNRSILNEIKIIDEIVKNTTIKLEQNAYDYRELCGIKYRKCFENPIIEFISEFDQFLSNKYRLKYPVDIDPLTYSYKITNLNFGGVSTNNEGYIQTAKALRLMYCVDESDPFKSDIIQKWKVQAHKNIQSHNFQFIIPLSDSLHALLKISETITEKIKFLISVVIVVVSILSMISLMTNNWVKSKPWLGIASVIAAGMAIGEAFGFMSLWGIESTDWNIAIPVLILVTEIDDSYVMIACWRTTDCQNEVERRMEETYVTAAVSITISSLTNFISYCIGIIAPFPAVRSFAIYSSACIFFAYFSQIIFFGACMALSGYREKKGIHPFTFHSRGCMETYNENNSGNNEEYLMKIFREVIGRALSIPLVKAIIIFLYFMNLLFGILNFLSLKDGLNIFNLYPSESEIFQSFQVYEQNFKEYPYAIQVVINGTLDYSKLEIQKSIDNFLTRLESHSNIADEKLRISWLKYYKTFQRNPVAKYSLGGLNMSKKQDFIDGLQIFFNFKAAEELSSDVIFNHNHSEIIRSRFFLMAKNLSNITTEVNLLNDLWEITKTAKFPVVIHHFFGNFIEQVIVIRNITYQLFWITGVLTIIIFILFIPNFLCATLVGVSIISTVVETLGFMYLWNINLNIISMFNLIFCVGFCINYPTHISYAFLLSSDKNSNEKMKNSLYHVGFPIIQGFLTTTLGILIILIIKETYVFTIYIKISFIISVLTTFHAMLVIPVVLSLIHCNYKTKNIYKQIRKI